MKRFLYYLRLIGKRKGGSSLNKHAALFILGGLLLVAGCSNSREAAEPAPLEVVDESVVDESEPQENAEEKNEQQLMEAFTAHVNDSDLATIAHFMEEQMPNMSKEQALDMIRKFEELQLEYLPILEEKFFEENIQQQMYSEYHSILKGGGGIGELKEGPIYDLIKETIDSGFKVEMAEGSYFPIIDYRYYKTFSPYVTEDIQDYIELMARESDRVPAKDAALVIGWGELVKRAITQEQFIATHPQSEKLEQIKKLYENYLTFILYGLNNTPLFDYDASKINEEAKKEYEEALTDVQDSETKKIVEGLLELVEKSNGVLNEEIENYRKEYEMK